MIVVKQIAVFNLFIFYFNVTNVKIKLYLFTEKTLNNSYLIHKLFFEGGKGNGKENNMYINYDAVNCNYSNTCS